MALSSWRTRDHAGLLAPGPPPVEGDAFDVAYHYLSYQERNYGRASAQVKWRAKAAVVWTAAANGAIALLGGVTALLNAPWIGLISTGIAGAVGVVAAWDAHFRHRQLWIQRSLVLGDLQTLKRNVELARAVNEDRNDIAHWCMSGLNSVLADDRTAWAEIRRVRPSEDKN